MKALAGIVLLVGAIVLGATLFPRTRTVDHPVVIRTVHDTVQRIDTVELVRRIQALKPDTVFLERQTVTPPETITVVPPLTGITLLQVGKNVGDTTWAVGYYVRPLGAGRYAMHSFSSDFYTAGPLAGMQLFGDTLKAAFYPAPKAPCTFVCKGRLATASALLGVSLYVLLHGR